MRVRVFFIAAILLVMVPFKAANADEYATAAIGVFNTGKASYSESKFLNVGHREPLGFGITHQYEAGGWTDVAGGSRKSSAYAAYQLGVEADGPITARVMTGPALITNPDGYLGGVFQFTEDFYFGIKGNNGNTVGIKYKHISSAGLEQPNVGRDYMGFEVSIPW